MDCPRCKLTNPDTAQRCDCGYDFGTKTVEKPYGTPELSGIGGWLAFLILSLTVFTPILTLYNLGSEINTSGLTSAVAIDGVISIAIASFGVYAGICLFRTKPNAVRIAKRYLIVLFIYSALTMILWMIGSAYQPYDEALQNPLIGIFRSLIYAIIWYSYLAKSKRVAATYTAPVQQGVEIPAKEVGASQTSSRPVTQNAAVAASAAFDAKRVESSGSGILSVISIPPGADIEVDEAFLGSTPSELPMNLGDHSLRITKNGFKPFVRKLRVISGAKQTVSADLEPDGQ